MSDEDKKDNNELFNNFSDDEISELEKMADEIAKEGDNSATVPAEELEDTSFSQDVPSTGSNDVDEILSKAKELAENQGEIELSENQLKNDENIVTDIENADNQKEESLPELDANSEFDEAVSNDSEPPSWVSESPPIDEYEGHTFDNSGYTEADDIDKELNSNTAPQQASNSDSALDREAENEVANEISHQNEPDDNLDSEFQDSNSVDLSAESSTFDTQSHQLNDKEEEVVNDEHFEVDNSQEPQIILDDELNSDEPAEHIEHNSTETYEDIHQDDSDAFDRVEEDVVADETQEIIDVEDVSHDSDFSIELNNEGEIDQGSITSTPVDHQEQPTNLLANQQPAVNYGHQPVFTHTKSLMSFGFGSLSALFNRKNDSSQQREEVGYSFSEHLKNAAQRDIQKLKAMQKEQCKLLDMAAQLTNPKEYDSNNRDRVLGLLGRISEASNSITAQANRLSISTSNMSDVSAQLEANNKGYKADSEKLLKDIEDNTSKLDESSLQEAAKQVAKAFREVFNKLFSSDKNAKQEMSMQ